MRIETNRVKKSAGNFIWLFFLISVTSLFPFIIRSLMIHYIGLEYTGVSSLFTSVLQILNLADLGIDNAIVFYLYKPFAEHDVKKSCRIIRLFQKTYRAAGIIILTVGFLLIPILPDLVKGKEYPAGLNLIFVYVIFVLNSAIPYLTAGYKAALFRADQRVDVVSRIGGLTAMLMYVLQIVAIVKYRDFYFYSILLLINPILQTAIISHKADREYRSILESKEEKSLEEPGFFLDFRKRVVAIALSKLRNTSRNSFDSVVISSIIGLGVLAKYQNYYQVMLVPVLLNSMLHAATAPSIGNSIATRDKRTNYNVLIQYTFLDNMITTICLSCLINLYQPFMKLWLGEEYLLPNSIVVIFCIYFYCLSISDITVLLRETTGVWWEGRLVAIVEALANLVLDIVLVYKFEINGVVVATIITILFINIPFEFYFIFRTYFEKGPADYLKIILKFSVVSLLITVLSWFVCSKIIIVSVGMMILRIVISVVFPIVLLYLVYGRTKQMKEVISTIRRAISR